MLPFSSDTVFTIDFVKLNMFRYLLCGRGQRLWKSWYSLNDKTPTSVYLHYIIVTTTLFPFFFFLTSRHYRDVTVLICFFPLLVRFCDRKSLLTKRLKFHASNNVSRGLWQNFSKTRRNTPNAYRVYDIYLLFFSSTGFRKTVMCRYKV